MINSSIIIFFASSATVFLLAIQQKNVEHHYYYWSAATSFALAFTQYQMINAIVAGGAWWMLGLGGAIGCNTAMYIHKRFIHKE